MTVACIVQARLGSTRLPAKVLLPLPTGRMVLVEVLTRCWQIPGIDTVVLALPDTPENDILLRCVAGNTVVVRGSEHDVLGRYLKAAHAVGAKTVMRITADCPLIDPSLCGDVLRHFQALGPLDYCSNVHPRTLPQGLDCEVMTSEALLVAASDATEAQDREHVTPWIIRNPDCRQSHLVYPYGDRSHLRWTLDTLEDYVRIWRLFEEQMGDRVEAKPITSGRVRHFTG